VEEAAADVGVGEGVRDADGVGDAEEAARASAAQAHAAHRARSMCLIPAFRREKGLLTRRRERDRETSKNVAVAAASKSRTHDPSLAATRGIVAVTEQRTKRVRSKPLASFEGPLKTSGLI
jgi:hypothetical protein